MFFVSVLLVVLGFFSATQAQPVLGDREIRYGIAAHSMYDAWGEQSDLGGEAFFIYDFVVSSRSTVGLLLAWQQNVSLGSAPNRLNYGVVLNHRFCEISSWACPFFEYGMTTLHIFRPGVSGSALSHDTRLGIGFEVPVRQIPVQVTFRYHLVPFRSFGAAEAARLNYWGLSVGSRMSFAGLHKSLAFLTM